MLVRRTYLEMRSPAALRPSHTDDPAVAVEPLVPCTVADYRALYESVGRDYHWRDRTVWSDAILADHLAQPTVSVWVMRYDHQPAGYFELARHDDGSVEIAYFGLTRAFIGRGLGKHLLTRAAEEAWHLGTDRVWLHTCTLDHPAALPNYIARGFTPYRSETYEMED